MQLRVPKLSLLNTVLLLLLVGTGLAFYIAEQQESSLPTLGADTQQQSKPAKITILHAHDHDHEAIELTRIGESKQWLLEHPIRGRANGTIVNQIASIFSTGIQDTITSDGSLELTPFGLSPPQSTLILDGQRVDFGNRNPVTQHRYLLYNGVVYTAEDTVFPLLSKEIADLLDTALFAHSSDSDGEGTIQSIAVQHHNNPAKSFTITHEGDGGDDGYHITIAGQDAPVGVALLEQWISTLGYIRALTVAPHPQQKSADKALVTITITHTADRVTTLHSYQENTFVRDDGYGLFLLSLNQDDYSSAVSAPSDPNASDAGTTGS